jgi:hypothetical protein
LSVFGEEDDDDDDDDVVVARPRFDDADGWALWTVTRARAESWS